MSNRLSTFRRRGLAFPGGFNPGVDLSHPAAKGLRFSGVALPGGRFVSLRDAKKGTVTSTFTNAIHGIVGPIITSTGTGQIAFAGQALTAPSSITIGAIIVGPADGTNGVIINTTSASAACPMFWKDPGTNTLSLTTDTGVHSTNSTIPITAGVPYFVAVSYASLTAPIKFVVTNFLTGVITQSSVANTFTAVASNGTYCIAGDGVGDTSTGIVAAVMLSTAGITPTQLWQWAQDPWSFWYPTPQGVVAFDPAFVKAPSGGGSAFTLSLAGGTYTFSGTAAALKRGIGLALGSGSYSFTGSSATPAVGMPLAGGSYSYSGTAATLNARLALALGSGSYSFTGSAVTLAVGLPLAGGSYAFTGTAGTLGVGMTLAGGTYNWNGTAATLTLVSGADVIAGSGSFTWSGTVVALAAALSLAAFGGRYAYAGSAVSLAYAPAHSSTIEFLIKWRRRGRR